MASKPRPAVLVSNDDGIQAPGLQALVAALVNADFCSIYVCAPSGERSAQSHAITLGRYLACTETSIAGVQHAVAVDGTPADSVMLALQSPVMEVSDAFLMSMCFLLGSECVCRLHHRQLQS